ASFRRPSAAPPPAPAPRYQTPPSASPGGDFPPEPSDRRPLVDAPASRNGSTGITRAPLGEPAVESPRVPAREPVVPLGPSRGGAPIPSPVAVSPPATLACPMVSELERWITGAVQPAAMRWFRSPG